MAGLAHGIPTHSVEPSPRLWCFQIGVSRLEGVDEVAAGVERLAAVRRGRRDDDGEVADLQRAGAVHGGDPHGLGARERRRSQVRRMVSTALGCAS